MIGFTATRILARVLLCLALAVLPAVALADTDDADTDLDGLHDEVDNCPLVYNPDQVDADEDGLGDLCDSDVAESAG